MRHGFLRDLFFAAVVAVTGLAIADPVRGQAILCDEAAALASQQTGVPLRVLMAVTRTETGRSQDSEVRPWPWVANFAGEGRWFESAASAEARISSALAEGLRNFDVGCFQLNYRWHHDGFASLREMLNPLANALYAARFLVRLRGEFGTWESAVAAYHSRTPQYAERYLQRYRMHYADLGGQDGSSDLPVPARVATGPSPLAVGRRAPLFDSDSTAPLVAGRSTPFITSRARPLWEGSR